MTKDDDPYPLQGVKLSSLQEFVKRTCLEQELDHNELTTSDFCSQIVLPRTLLKRCALIDLFSADLVRTVATIFISHAWSGRIWETLLAVEEQCGIENDERFVWLDCCSVNQHEVLAHSADWYSSTFHTAIQTIGLTCIVLTPVMAPTPLKRSWCLWELYGTLLTKTPLKICVPSTERAILLDLIRRDFLQIMKNICNVDAAKAEAFRKDDQDRIREAINATVGIERINEAALDPLRYWLLETATDAISNSVDPELHRGLGLLRFDLGKIDEAKMAFQESLRLRQDALALDIDNPALQLAIAGDLTNLASCALETGLPKLALQLYDESLRTRLKLGNKEEDEIIAYSNKGLAHKALKQYAEAMDCFKTAVALSDRPEAIEDVLINTAECMREMGQPGEAIGILERLLISKRERLGAEHVSVAQVMNLLGQTLLDCDRLDEAEPLLNNALRIRQRALGGAHPRVGLCIANLAKLDVARGNRAKAKERFDDLIRLQREAFGDDHPFVRQTMEMSKTLLETNKPSVQMDHSFFQMSNIMYSHALPTANASPSEPSGNAMMIQMAIGMQYPTPIAHDESITVMSQKAYGLDMPLPATPPLRYQLRELSVAEMYIPEPFADIDKEVSIQHERVNSVTVNPNSTSKGITTPTVSKTPDDSDKEEPIRVDHVNSTSKHLNSTSNDTTSKTPPVDNATLTTPAKRAFKSGRRRCMIS